MFITELGKLGLHEIAQGDEMKFQTDSIQFNNYIFAI